MRKNELVNGFIAAICIVIVVFAFVGIIMLNYSVNMRRKLYETSSDNLNEVYTQVSEKFMQLTDQQWKLLGMTGDYIDEADADIEDIEQFLAKWKKEWHFTEFYFLNDNCKYLSASGRTGYLELGNAWNSLVVEKQNVVVDGSLPGSDEVMFFAIPVNKSSTEGFEYDSIAVSYNTEDINKELGVTAFADKTSSYIVYANGDTVLQATGSDDIGRNIFYYLRNAEFTEGSLDEFINDMKTGENGELVFTLNDEQYYLVYLPVGFEDWVLASMVPLKVADSNIADIQKMTVVMAAHISVLLLMIAVIVLYTYYRKYASYKNHEIARRDMLFSIMSKNLDDVYIMLSWGDWEKLYISSNMERILGVKNEKDINLCKLYKLLEKKGDIPEWAELKKIKPGESAINEYWIKPQNSNEYKLFKQSCYHLDNGRDNVMVIILSDRTYEQEIRNHIEEALHTAETANSAKSRFLSNMSHDIRTPMNAIVGFSQLLLRHDNQPEKVRKYAEKIVVSSQHLLGLINDVLDMSKIESGKTSLNLSNVNLADVVVEIDSIIRPQTKKRNQTFVIKSDEAKLGYIKADKIRLNQILLNILSNAVKYTPEGGNITFEIKGIKNTGSQFAHYSFIISDNGIGMSSEYIKDIFKPFTREESSVVENIQGTGLGMPITKSLVDLMGGTINIDSVKGEGTTFEVMLEFGIPDVEEFHEFKMEKNSNEGGRGVLVGKNFLVAEDNVINAEMLKELLRTEGATCDFAKDGRSVVNTFSKSSPGQYDMIFMDVQMPNMDGYEATRAIRQLEHPDAKNIPIVALTADAFTKDVNSAVESGMNGHIAKPVDVERIKEIVGSLVIA